MAEKVPSFQNGGALWFTDLTTPESMLILPILTAMTFWITVERFLLSATCRKVWKGNLVAQTMKTYSRILAVIEIPVMMSFLKALLYVYSAIAQENIKQDVGAPVNKM